MSTVNYIKFFEKYGVGIAEKTQNKNTRRTLLVSSKSKGIFMGSLNITMILVDLLQQSFFVSWILSAISLMSIVHLVLIMLFVSLPVLFRYCSQ